MKPTLVCLDFEQHTAKRYWPKPNGFGFEVWSSGICAVEDQTSAFSSAIENFRQGPDKKKSIPYATK